MSVTIELTYIAAAILFATGLKLLGRPDSARRGNLLSGVGMLLAVTVTLLHREIMNYQGIAAGVLTGSVAGILMARGVAMTQMPEMVGLLNGFGGLASMLVAWEDYLRNSSINTFAAISVALSVLIGAVTFSGSILACAKLGEKISPKPLIYSSQHWVNGGLVIASLVCVTLFIARPENTAYWLLMASVLALVVGITSVLPIGGADMPVVISLLNSYSGLAACATGFVLQNSLLIVAGTLVGASGIILTQLMCKAMNRPLGNVLFSGFGAVEARSTKSSTGSIHPIDCNDTFALLEAARSVVIVPGYGMAVAQAHHAVRELAETLQANGAEVRFAIHPVAGRMPGHMNVLLAEANVPYDQLWEMQAINPDLPAVDVCVVIGANDVVNPAAREDKSSPIYGMPIINADRARTVIVLKRSMAAGFAGIENRLFLLPNTRMLFGDAKYSLQTIIGAFKELAPQAA